MRLPGRNAAWNESLTVVAQSSRVRAATYVCQGPSARRGGAENSSSSSRDCRRRSTAAESSRYPGWRSTSAAIGGSATTLRRRPEASGACSGGRRMSRAKRSGGAAAGVERREGWCSELGYGEYRSPLLDGRRASSASGLGGEDAEAGYGGRLYGMCSCTGEPRCSDGVYELDAGTPRRRRGWKVNGGSIVVACAPSAGACVWGDMTVQSCAPSSAVVVGYVRRLRRRPVPDFTTCPYPGLSGERQLSGNVGLGTVVRCFARPGEKLIDVPKERDELVADGPGDSEQDVNDSPRCRAQHGLPAGEAQGNLVGHPGALDFQVPSSDPTQFRREVGLRLYHLDDVGCSGKSVVSTVCLQGHGYALRTF